MYGKSDSVTGKSISRFGKKKPEGEMQSVALKEAKDWLEELMDADFRGRGDHDYIIRGRISDETGIPESYLFRLQLKSRDMKDVAGEYYRRMKLHYEKYCEKNEEAADRYRSERLGMTNETTDEKPASAGLGMAVPAVGKASQKKA